MKNYNLKFKSVPPLEQVGKMHQKTALADGFKVTVVGKPTIASPAELNVYYHNNDFLSNYASVERTGFEPAVSTGEVAGLPLAYRPTNTEVQLLSQRLNLKVKGNEDSPVVLRQGEKV